VKVVAVSLDDEGEEQEMTYTTLHGDFLLLAPGTLLLLILAFALMVVEFTLEDDEAGLMGVLNKTFLTSSLLIISVLLTRE
jgi:hypothetical protein